MFAIMALAIMSIKNFSFSLQRDRFAFKQISASVSEVLSLYHILSIDISVFCYQKEESTDGFLCPLSMCFMCIEKTSNISAYSSCDMPDAILICLIVAARR